MARAQATPPVDGPTDEQDGPEETSLHHYLHVPSGTVHQFPAAPITRPGEAWYRLVNEDADADDAIAAGEQPLHAPPGLDAESYSVLLHNQYGLPGRIFGRDGGGQLRDMGDASPDDVPKIFNYEGAMTPNDDDDPALGPQGDREISNESNQIIYRGGQPRDAERLMNEWMRLRGSQPTSAAPARNMVASSEPIGPPAEVQGDSYLPSEVHARATARGLIPIVLHSETNLAPVNSTMQWGRGPDVMDPVARHPYIDPELHEHMLRQMREPMFPIPGAQQFMPPTMNDTQGVHEQIDADLTYAPDWLHPQDERPGELRTVRQQGIAEAASRRPPMEEGSRDDPSRTSSVVPRAGSHLIPLKQALPMLLGGRR